MDTQQSVMNSPKEKWIVDCDPGCDDMMALLYLLSRTNVEVLMIGLEDGNVPLDHVTANGRKIIKLAGKKIPLYRGSPNPIIKKFPNADSYHYCDGLGDIEEIRNYTYDDIPVEQESSMIKLVEYINLYPNEINLLCLGPLTSIACAYMVDPSIVDKLKSTWMMGGSIASRGNLSPLAEFNFAYDFLSANIVLNNFKNIIITPWEPVETCYLRELNMQTFNKNIVSKNKKLRELVFSFSSLIITKFTTHKNGIQLCDLYSVMPFFNGNVVKKFSMCKINMIVDSETSMGTLTINSRKEIKIPFSEFMKTEFLDYKNKQYHLIVEELNDWAVLEEFETVFHE